MTNVLIKIESANLCCQIGMASGNWSAGKKSSTSLDHWSYYMIVATEHEVHGKILDRRRLNFPPLAEGRK